MLLWKYRQLCQLLVHQENHFKEREYQKDELAQIGKQDKITNFDDITENHAPDNYQFYKVLQCIVFYTLVFSVTSGFPAVYGAIKIDKELHVELEWCGDPVPLPQWFVKGKKAKLSKCEHDK